MASFVLGMTYKRCDDGYTNVDVYGEMKWPGDRPSVMAKAITKAQEDHLEQCAGPVQPIRLIDVDLKVGTDPALTGCEWTCTSCGIVVATAKVVADA